MGGDFYRANHDSLIEIAYSDKNWSKINFDALYGGDIAFELNDGINLDKSTRGTILYMQDCVFLNSNYKIVCFGLSTKDFKGFLNSLNFS